MRLVRIAFSAAVFQSVTMSAVAGVETAKTRTAHTNSESGAVLSLMAHPGPLLVRSLRIDRTNLTYHRLSWFWLLSKVTRTPVEHADADAPIVRVYSTAEVRRLFHAFSQVKVVTERFPAKTKKFKGWKGLGFNGIFVPLFNALPTSLTARWGWHLMIYARK